MLTRRSVRWITLFSLLVVIWSDATVSAQDDAVEKKEAKAADVEEKPKAPKKQFTVPEGSAEELFAFINTVKRTRSKARTREGSIAHLKEQVTAVLEACDKIAAGELDEKTELKVITEKLGALGAASRSDATAAEQMAEYLKRLEADERDFIVEFLRLRKMSEKARMLGRIDKAERTEFLKELFGSIEKNGLDRSMYSTVSTAARSLGATDSDAAATVYEELAKAMAESDDEALSSRAEKTRGSARRMKLPGNFMEINGTTAEGEQFDWASYRGKVVLVDFWASWCGPCRAEIPNMKKQLENYSDKGFAILGVNLDTTKAAYQKYVDAQELTWTNLMSDKEGEMGWDNPLASHYGISGIPTALLVDKEGKVVSMRARGSELNRLLEDILGPVEAPDTIDDDQESELKNPEAVKEAVN